MAVIPLWNKCNSNCIMCTNPSQFKDDDIDFSYKNIKDRLTRHRKTKNEFIEDDAHDKFYLTGGEPTMNPDLIKIIKEIYKQFPGKSVSLLTNGRSFIYEEYVKKIGKLSNLDEIIIPLHGHNRQSHDAITRSPGSFDQTFRGLSNIFKYKRKEQKIEIRIVISKFNYESIDKILMLIKKYFYMADSVPVIFMEFEGQAEENYSIIGLRYSEFRSQFVKLEKFLGEVSGLRFYHFPLCVVPEKFWPYLWRTLPEYEVFFDEKCNKCKYKDYCLGIHKHYDEIYGVSEFKPISKIFNIKKSKNFYKPFN